MMDRSRAPPAPRPASVLVLGALAGLVLAPLAVGVVGTLMFSHRPTWNVGQGESFVVFLVALYSVPIGVAYWLVAAAVAWSLPRRRRWPALLVALGLSLLIAALVLQAVDF